MYPEISFISLDPVHFHSWHEKNIEVCMLRLDTIHPVISGNKWFKLKYHLENFRNGNFQGIISFGGAWSNHIAATAFAARLEGIPSAGIIRGRRPEKFSVTLQEAADQGMHLEFVSHAKYKQKEQVPFLKELNEKFPGYYIIPEGGKGPTGKKGAKEILQLASPGQFSHIACAIGTGTMFSGIADASMPGQQLIGIPVVKGLKNVMADLEINFEDPGKQDHCHFFYEYHHGGYARYNPALINLMNRFYEATRIPTDFVYTGKLVFAVHDLITNNYFPRNSRILLIHSGGLQGNRSLPKGKLIF